MSEQSLQLDIRLTLVTGKSIEQLWPKNLRDAIKAGQAAHTATRIVTVGPQMLSLAAARNMPAELPPVNDDEFEELMQRLAALSDRRQLIIRLRYGLDGDEPMTYQQIGDRLGVTKERVRQIELGALERLRWGEWSNDVREALQARGFKQR